MKHWHTLFVGALVAFVVAPALVASGRRDSPAAGLVYVDAGATGANDGSSWEDAFTDLQPALDTAVAGDQIWVAEGTYKPTVEHGGAGSRFQSFQMKNGVAIYGGFDPPVDDLWQDRDWVRNVTILSGDIGSQGDPADNSYHVFYHPGELALDGTAVLDGFTVTGGNADGDSSDRWGGGMKNVESSPTVTNCTFSGNMAEYGGGMLNHASSPTVTNCTFSGNSSTWFGGGMLNMYSSSPTVTNCIFSGNLSVQSHGGGMCNVGSSPLVTNCAFSTNVAAEGSAMSNTFGSAPSVTNSILWGDSLPEILNEESEPVVTHSDVQGGYDGTGNIDADPHFLDPGLGNYHLRPGSPCIDVGDNDAPSLPAYDFEGDDRILDGNGDGTAIVDMGVDEAVFSGAGFQAYLPLGLKGY